MHNKRVIRLRGTVGLCGHRRVFLGFAPASTLYSLSFADVLDETTGKGYQRRFNEQHSLEFRKYLRRPGATTIPLTFNLRPSDGAWKLVEKKDGTCDLRIQPGERVLAQVDCQHRLGYLKDADTPLAFMSFVGLSPREEMEIFNTINSKAKGLSSSLLDFHESRLSEDLKSDKPEIYIAIKLNETATSPWYQRLDLGGKRTVGMKRYASLRTMQKAVRRFLRESNVLEHGDAEEAFAIVFAYWGALKKVLAREWVQPRKYFLMKGIGVYCLMSIAGDLYAEAQRKGITCDIDYFTAVLSDFITDFDWSNHGPLRGYGGASGADQALQLLRNIRATRRLKVIGHG